MEDIIKNINAQNRLVKDLLTRLFSEDKVSKVPISLEMLLQAWGEDGSWCRRLGRELTTCFPVSWNTDTLKFSCTVPDCPGGEVCKRNAVNKFKPLIDEAAYSRKVVQKCLFRWWEFTLCSRLWRPGAPRRNRAQPVAEPVEGIVIDAESEWRAIHNLFGKTFDFFSRPTVCSSLILTLQSLLCAHQNMGWIMKYLGFHRNASIDGGDDAEPHANAAGGGGCAR